MRTLTSIQSATAINADFNLELTLSDQSSTYIYDKRTLVDLSSVSWEIPFNGGLGKTSSYQATISSSLGWIKDNISKINKANVRLNINVNSDEFQPHSGRVREVKRFGSDPNLFQITVFDAFLDSVPKFPPLSVADSYATPHPKVLDSDIGQTRYYGEQVRPFFHVPVDCSIGSLLSPLNVAIDSGSSVYYVEEEKGNLNIAEKTVYSMNKVYFQDSFSIENETINHATPFDFEIKDNFRGRIATVKDVVEDPGSVDLITEKANKGFSSDYSLYNTLPSVNSGNNLNLSVTFDSLIKEKIYDTTRIYTTYAWSGELGVTVGVDLFIWDDESVGTVGKTATYTSSYSYTLEIDCSTDTNNFLQRFIQSSGIKRIKHSLGQSSIGICASSYEFWVSLKSEFYNNYSIYSFAQNCSSIAVSKNPVGILDSVFDISSISYLQDQSSTAQTSLTNYNFNCVFSERENLDKIIQDFGEISATYMWLGDSGSMQYRVYQDSSQATVNKSITPDDILNFELLENPIGSSQFQAHKVRRVKVDYGFNFNSSTYESNQLANPNNNSLCSTMDSLGIDRDLIKKTKYILDSDTASYYTNNLVRNYCQIDNTVKLKLPARFFELELADIIKIEHPMIVGSESLYQIVKIDHDYKNGTVGLTGQELQN